MESSSSLKADTTDRALAGYFPLGGGPQGPDVFDLVSRSRDQMARQNVLDLGSMWGLYGLTT